MLGQVLLVLTALAGTVIAAPAELQPRVISGVEWSVTNFTRVCTSSPSACTYNFTIVPGGSTANTTCSIVNTVSDPIHSSFYAVPCNSDWGNEWNISWGYSVGGDTSVMTVLNTGSDDDAWFGWNGVSTKTDFNDVGPNPVYAVGTFVRTAKK